MHRCLHLAALGRGNVGNGAMVGAVLVRHGSIIAEAYHSGFGKPHAERELVEKFEYNSNSDDVLYVNLEPCCHRGKTPPCTEIILERGIKHVVFGMVDPDPRVSGKGIEVLRKNGVDVRGPVSRALCERLNRGFISVRTKGRPWITLKRVQTKAGAIANPDGTPLKITSPEQDVLSHTFLRTQSDAILVGVGTIISDDPRLDVRLAGGLNGRLAAPYRIILDPTLRIPLSSRVVTDDQRQKTIIVTSNDIGREKIAELQDRGVMVFQIPLNGKNFDLPELWKKLTTPSGEFHGITSVLVEGGSKTWEAFREAGSLDEEVVLVGA
ncbi:bifunctional diaminohydroxyphosphoribosylaminopyrimidine deaminase/5-amino-6-(5-phosphoribosylamino)uracil reductase RibD [Candidatus Peregrinibacteria bacterium]|nr:bifunctional diaminohydroxyphosphoribosylaminopyrimidine deaminase/5-amino-6-(5-phosphoribosylamino)uracil reductase RibD [Candidatus Peregrinibacteria bacterium]MBI3816562.1 bifunctional diaminohydroxyphosphoribosylaminopyrimidine deaminase/5-amino-6-(5-phosphoribosylamino)uracil reductase RibD [Candidatus Peregrinibacteria bacterium]